MVVVRWPTDRVAVGLTLPPPLGRLYALSFEKRVGRQRWDMADVEYPKLLSETYEVGMGTVFRCRDQWEDRELAVKFLSRELLESKSGRRRFDHEGRILAKLRHPNIVVIHAHGIEAGFPYLVMELCVDGAGQPLTLGKAQRRSPKDRLPTGQLLELLAPLLAGVGYLHDLGLVHRDLKPDNILLQPDDQGRAVPKLSDFGLVALTNDEKLRARFKANVSLSIHTGDDKVRAMVGTWDYMSPEQRKGGAIDARSDIYSLGRILYRLATGYSRVTQHYPTQVNPDLPPWFDDFVERAAKRVPADRYRTAREMYDKLPKELRRAHIDWLREQGYGNLLQRLWHRLHALVVGTRRRWRSVQGRAAAQREPVEVETRAAPPVEVETPAAPPAEVETPVAGAAYTVRDSGMELVPIKAGSFTMGSPATEEGRASDEPQHQVTLTQSFWLGKYEVTQEEYEQLRGDNPSGFKGARLPVERVSWDDATAFCSKLTESERKSGRLPADCEYRLPAEAEWEYACRAGTQTALYNGDLTSEFGRCSNLDQVGWYDRNSDYATHPVGGKAANAWGIYDMLGNVWEWCSDWYGDYPAGTVSDPAGPRSGSSRVSRGGSWGNGARGCRAAGRYRNGAALAGDSLGFRVALAPASAVATE